MAFFPAFYLAYLLAYLLACFLAFFLAEVRQRTLGVDGRGWGPAANTGRGWSRLRSSSEHLAWMVVVEVWRRTLGVDGRG